MNRSTRFTCTAILGAVLACAASACNNGSGSPVGDAGHKSADASLPTTPKGVCLAFLGAYVSRYDECEGAPTDQGFVVSVGNFTFILGPGYLAHVCDGIAADVAAGKTTFDGSQLAACESAIAATSCDSVFGPGGALQQSACQGLFKGTVAGGGSCLHSDECVSTSCTTTSCPGTCDTPVAMGGDCSGGQRCVAGLVCLSSGSSMTCQPAPGLGQPCSGTCAAGSYCDSSTKSCAAYKAIGASCYPGQCQIGLLCLGGSSYPTMVAGVCTTPVAKGGLCTPGKEQCAPGLWCSSGSCSEMARIGGPCGLISGEYVACVDSACNAASGGAGSCSALAPAGASCNPMAFLTIDCAYDSSCVASSSGTSGTCTASPCD